VAQTLQTFLFSDIVDSAATWRDAGTLRPIRAKRPST
jgi:hypothetical protein